MMGRWSESQLHITAGHRLLKQAGTGEATMSAAEILTRLDLQAMTFSDSSAPYAYDDTPRSVYIDALMRQEGRLESYAQAGTALFGLMRRFMLLGETLVADDGEQGEEAIIQNLMQDIASWEYKMADFERNRDPHNAIGAISIRLYHTLLRMCVIVGAYGPEARWDRVLGYFERILTLAELLCSNTPNTNVQTPLSLEPGLIMPVFVTCQRCRHPWLRRKGIAFLYKIKRQEGMWSSDGAAVVAEKIMEAEGQVYYTSDLSGENSPSPVQVEEMSWEEWATGDGQLPAKTSWAGIPRVPEKGRVRDTLVMVEAEQKRIHLSLIMSPGEDALSTLGQVRAETVTY
ncbi:hypothetical protein N0V84_001218 [Fusarium piperis]|uniref:Uncharacterized protein n=1 Tax=Fusarium piperis TaxID=1435070 RepID=A0A9W8WLW9_9HYPO|nr:hypothetical protein N0V84_001218 [Fusarium piperis]